MTPQLGKTCQDDTAGLREPATGHGGLKTAVRPLELRQWATWLRLNAPRQVRGAFRRRQRNGTTHVCPLGALEEIGAAQATVLFCPLNEAEFMRRIRLMNDSLGWTFPQIADWLDGIAGGTLSLRRALRVRLPADLPLAGK